MTLVVVSGVVTTSTLGTYPRGVAINSTGSIFAANPGMNGYHVIWLYSKSGRPQVYAGKERQGFADGSVGTALFYSPSYIAIDSVGTMFVSDYTNNVIRKISAGMVTTLAGGFRGPSGVAVDSSGNVFVADSGNNAIRRVSPTGLVTTVDSGKLPYVPNGIALDSMGNVYVSCPDQRIVMMISPDGKLTTIAGGGSSNLKDGVGTNAGFTRPSGLAVDSFGNVYVADTPNSYFSVNAIRRISSQ